ncbi:EAL domain-containing protein [Massilia sp. H-1]|nr:EAL domain-containing protein [Massilia sp. H-1]
MNAQSLARLDLGKTLRRAIDNHEFVLYLQPKVHIGSGRISGAEALIRWKRPGHGMVSQRCSFPCSKRPG